MAISPRPAASRAQAATTYAIASGKGGVGKTWLSATLSSVFALRGLRTLLVDCDFGLANVDVQLGLRPHADLSAVLRGWIDLDAAVCSVLGGPSTKGGFDLLPGQSGVGSLAGVKLAEIDKLARGLQSIAPRYDATILDLPAGIDPNTQRMARAADALIVVTTEDPPALTDAYAFIKVMRGQGVTAPPWIVVNMADTRQSGKRVFDHLVKACEAYLGLAPVLAGVVCRDMCVSDAIRAQTLLSVRHPQSGVMDDMTRIAAALSTPR
jgi:flagellar biosynthesis protein FlhG